jgi:hypothetical protein
MHSLLFFEHLGSRVLDSFRLIQRRTVDVLAGLTSSPVSSSSILLLRYPVLTIEL